MRRSTLRYCALRFSRQIQFGSEFVVAGQRAQFFPSRLFHVDPRHFALLLADVFDLARIEHAARALRWRRGLQIARELGDLPLEIPQRPECRDIERSEEHTSELQSRQYLVCRLLLEKK